MAWTAGRATLTTVKALSTGGSRPAQIGTQVFASTANSAPVYLGPTTGVTAANGYPLRPGGMQYFPNTHGIIADPARIYAISSGGSRTVHWLALGTT